MGNVKSLAASPAIFKETPRFFLLIAIAVVALVFGIIQPKFLNINNIMNIICTSSIMGYMALGATIVLSAGEMNFAIGAEATLAATVAGFLLQGKVVPEYFTAVFIGLVIVVITGFCNSRIVFCFGVPSFITTLAMSKALDGIIYYLSTGKPMYSTNWPASFAFLGQGRIGDIPVAVIAFVIISFLAWILMDKSRLGRHIFSVGANSTACNQVGIKVYRTKTIAFICSSVLAGCAGIVGSSQVANVSPQLGNSIMMSSMASAMLGATFLRPGHFNIQGTIVAAILMTVIENGIISIGAPNYICDIVQGIILVSAVGFIAMTRKEGLPGVSIA